MKFWFVLLILGWRLRWLAWRNPEFREKLKDQDFVMQWRTEQGVPARSFHFLSGAVAVHGGLHNAPSISISFADAAYAFDTIKQAGKNQMVFMQGMQSGKIKLEGDMAKLMWFMGLMKYIMPKKKA
jgi:hypothetical protein